MLCYCISCIFEFSVTQCNGPAALKNFFDVTTDRSVMAVVGCGCSSATEEVAKISHYLNISVVRIIENIF